MPRRRSTTARPTRLAKLRAFASALVGPSLTGTTPPTAAPTDGLDSGGTLQALAPVSIGPADPTTAEAADDAPVRFSGVAYSGGVMYPNLTGIDWSGPVVVDVGGLTSRYSIPVHREHNRNKPVGHATIKTDDGRVTFSGVFSVDTDDSEEIAESSRNGFPWQASVGLGDMRWEKIAANKSVTVNGVDFVGPILVIRRASLNEISFVTVGGDASTYAYVTSSAATAAQSPESSPMSFEKWLASLNIQTATLTASALAQLQASYHALHPTGAAIPTDATATAAAPLIPAGSIIEPTAPAASPADASATQPAASATAAGQSQATPATDPTGLVASMRSAAAAEETRISAIREIGARYGNPSMPGGETLTAHAITNGWSADRVHLEASRMSRPHSPAIHSTSQDARGTVETLQAAILLRAGRPVDAMLRPSGGTAPEWLSRGINDPTRQRIMDHAQEWRDASMMEMVAQSLRACGHSVPSGRNPHAILSAGFSTNSVAAVFSQSIGAIALVSYGEVRDFTQGWTSSTDVLNLMETDRPRMAAGQDLTKHETDGEADHASMAAVNEKVKADRFSRQAQIDEIHFINDQFGMLRDSPVEFGRMARRLVPNMVAAVLLANANLAATGRALFNATDGSLLTGSALSAANLSKARGVLSRRKEGDASLNFDASHLLVPSDLGDLAIQLTKSAVISADSGAGSTNPLFMRSINPVEEGRLANGVVNPMTGATLAGSLTSWYLASNQAHTIEVQYLQGTGQQPIVVVEQLSGGKLGLLVVVKHYAGAKALDFRGIVRCDA